MFLLSDLFDNIEGIDAAAAEASFKAYLDVYCDAVDCMIPTPDPPMPGPATVSHETTPCYGSAVGDHFDDDMTDNALMEVREVHINSSIFVASISLLLSDGVHSMFTPTHGGSGGFDYVFVVA